MSPMVTTVEAMMTMRSQSGRRLLDLFNASIVKTAFIPTFGIGYALIVRFHPAWPGKQDMR
jgi:hypothetical protein